VSCHDPAEPWCEGCQDSAVYDEGLRDGAEEAREHIAAVLRHDASLARCASGFPGGPDMMPAYEVMEQIADWIAGGAKTKEPPP
jgi:hypothetical protein